MSTSQLDKEITYLLLVLPELDAGQPTLDVILDQVAWAKENPGEARTYIQNAIQRGDPERLIWCDLLRLAIGEEQDDLST